MSEINQNLPAADVEPRTNKEAINRALSRAKDVVDRKDDSTLSPTDRIKKHIFLTKLEETKDSPTRTSENKFKNNDTGEEYKQEEGIPVEWVVMQLREEAKNHPVGSDERKALQKDARLLVKNSKYYYQIPDRMVSDLTNDSEQFVSRVTQEAYFISQDERASTDPDETQRDQANYFAARGELLTRRELIMPEEEVIITDPPPPTESSESSTENVPPPIEEQIAFLVRGDVVINKRAKLLAKKIYENLLTEGGRWNPKDVLMRSWNRSLRPFYEKQYEMQIRSALEQSHNPYAEIQLQNKEGFFSRVRVGDVKVTNNNARRSDLSAEERAYIESAEIEDTGKAHIEGQKVTKLEGDSPKDKLRDLLMTNVIRPYVSDRSMTAQDLQQKLAQTVKDNLNDQDMGPLLKEFYGNTSAEHSQEVNYFITNLAEIGDKLRANVDAHRAGATAINDVIDANLAEVKIRLAEVRQGADAKDQFTWLDRRIADLQKRRWTAWAVNPTLVGASVGIAVTAGTARFGAKWMSLATPIGTGVGLVAAIARRRFEAVAERSSLNLRQTYGEQVPDEAKRLKKLEASTIKKASVNQLLEGDANRQVYNGDTRGMTELLANKLMPTVDTNPDEVREAGANREALIRRMAEVKARLDYSAQTHLDFVSFSGYEHTARGRLELVKAYVQGKVALQNAGMDAATLDSALTREITVWKGQLTQDKAVAEKAFRSYQLGEYTKTGLITIASGLTLGFVSQEGIALAGRGAGLKIGQTALEHRFNAISHTGVGQAIGMDRLAGAAHAVGLDRITPSSRINGIENFVNLYNNPGQRMDLPHGFHLLAQNVNGTEHPALLQDPTGKTVGQVFLEPNGHIVMPKNAPLPQDLKDIMKDWPQNTTKEHTLSQRLLETKNKGGGIVDVVDPTDPNKHTILTVSGDTVQVQGTNISGQLATTGEITFTGDQNQLSQMNSTLTRLGIPVTSIEDKPIFGGVDSLHKEIQDYIARTPQQPLGSYHDFPPTEGMHDLNIRLFTDGSHKVILSGPSLPTQLVGDYGIDGNFSFNQSSNPDVDFSKLFTNNKTGLLEQGGFTGALKDLPGVPVTAHEPQLSAFSVDGSANGIPAEFKAGIETGNTHKDWVFHVLRPDIVQATGNHTHNELTLHVGQFRGWNGEPGIINTGATTNGGIIPSYLNGVPPMRDSLLNSIINKNGVIPYDHMFAVVDLNDGRQFMLPFDSNGNVKLPEGFYNKDTGELYGIHTIATTILEKPDGTVYTPEALLGDKQFPEGIKVHSLASEVFKTAEPPPVAPAPHPVDSSYTPPADKLLYLAPPDTAMRHHFQFNAFPSENIDLTPPAGVEPLNAPAIPLPFAPRWFDRFIGIYGGEYGYNGGDGLLVNNKNINEYALRRSPRLAANPNAQLDEQQEVKDYLAKQPTSYRQEIEQLNNTLGEPMSEQCRAVITIPAYEEGGNIRKTLEHFLQQKNKDGSPLDPSLFEIIIVDNHPADKHKDNTEDEVRRFLSDHPSSKVRYIHKAWGENEIAGVGNARKYATDIAMIRGVQRPRQLGDLILVSFDADVDGVSDKYVADMIHEFDTNKNVDAVAGKFDLPENALAKPNIRAAQRLWYIFDRVKARNAYGDPLNRSNGTDKDGNNKKEGREYRSPDLIGRNSAFRASILAAVGGYNERAKLAEDLEIGWLISDARQSHESNRRQWDSTGPVESKDRMTFVNSASVTTNPRRFLAAYVQGTPLVRMYDGFHENTEVRQLDNESLLQKIPNKFDVKNFEMQANGIWNHFMTNPYVKDVLPDVFERTMGLMGVKYKIEKRQKANGDKYDYVVITDTTRLEEGLKRVTPPSRIQSLLNRFRS